VFIGVKYTVIVVVCVSLRSKCETNKMDEMDEMDHKGQGMGLETLRDGG
jgi:hypothetical protein